MNASTCVIATVDTTLVAAICHQHELAIRSAHQALEHARQAGELLIQAKGAVRHGAWLRWVAAHVPFSARTATRYMLLAQHWTAIQAKSDTLADLTVNEALRLAGAPRDAIPASLAEAQALMRSLAKSFEDVVGRLEQGDIAEEGELEELRAAGRAGLTAISAYLDRACDEGDLHAIYAVDVGMAAVEVAMQSFRLSGRQAAQQSKEILQGLRSKFGRKFVAEVIRSRSC